MEHSLVDAYIIVVMTVAGVLDLLYREIEPLYWVYSTLVGAVLYLKEAGHLLEELSLIHMILAILPVLVVAALYMAGAIGGADLLALVFLAASSPYLPGDILPVTVQAVIYASIPSLIHRIIMAWRGCGRASCLLSGRVRVEGWRLLRDPRFRWWLVSDRRLGKPAIDLENWEAVARLGGGEAVVEASPGLPYTAHLAVGTVAASLLGDEPILRLFLQLFFGG